MPETIQEKFMQVTHRIDQACAHYGRSKDEVNLIVVTKGQEPESISEVLQCGAKILGENYPEETVKKIDEIKTDLFPAWHMIGHLQSRKIKLMYPVFSCIHSVDSLELAQKINRFYDEMNAKVEVLIEVNIAGETSKFGFDASSSQKRELLLQEFERIFTLSNIKPLGLMTMPPYAANPSQNEACYNLCNEFCTSIREKFGLKEFKQLSMGTSNDFETAIKCGATFVRVGEAIMGSRNYQIKV